MVFSRSGASEPTYLLDSSCNAQIAAQPIGTCLAIHDELVMDADTQTAAFLLTGILHVKYAGRKSADRELPHLGELGSSDCHRRCTGDIGGLVDVEELARAMQYVVDVEGR